MNPFDLTNRDIWVLGGAGHLGRPLVHSLTLAGARVLCADLPGRAAVWLHEAALGAAVEGAEIDLSQVEKLEGWVRQQVEHRGVPHGLVLLAYDATASTFEALTAEEFDRVNRVNLTATFVLSRAVGTAMARAGRGSLVLFSSMYGSVAPDPGIYAPPLNPNPIEYGVGKAGLLQMTRYLAVQFGSANVRVNAIQPGPFPNPAIQTDHPEFIERLNRKVPLGRIGSPGEIAGSVQFLLSDASSYVTGHSLAVDGGWTAW